MSKKYTDIETIYKEQFVKVGKIDQHCLQLQGMKNNTHF